MVVSVIARWYRGRRCRGVHAVDQVGLGQKLAPRLSLEWLSPWSGPNSWRGGINRALHTQCDTRKTANPWSIEIIFFKSFNVTLNFECFDSSIPHIVLPLFFSKENLWNNNLCQCVCSLNLYLESRLQLFSKRNVILSISHVIISSCIINANFITLLRV